MSIMIREYFGFNQFEVEYNYTDKTQIQEAAGSYGAAPPIDPNSIMVDIEGIHAGATRNFTRYLEHALKNSVPTWTHPYLRPLILHHNEKDGKIIGRIHAVNYLDKSDLSGTAALLFTTNVPDKDGKEQVKDGRLMTTSIGIIGHDVRCSICGHQIAELGPCEYHERGGYYDGQIAYWDIHRMEGKELSYVVVPSDIFAKNVRIYLPKHYKDNKITESITEGVNDVALPNNKDEKDKQTPAGEQQTPPVADPATPPADPKPKEGEGEKTVEELKAENVQLAADKEALQTEKTQLADANTVLEAAKVSLESKVAELEGKIEEANKALQSAQDKAVLKEADAVQERQLRESLENQVVELKATVKTNLVESFNALRKANGKAEADPKELAERSEESLRDAIKDLKEEFKSAANPVPAPVQNPTIVESSDPQNVKEDENPRNIDLREGLNNLFSNVVTFHK